MRFDDEKSPKIINVTPEVISTTSLGEQKDIETKRGLEEKIAATKRKLAEIERELKIRSLETELDLERRGLRKSGWGKEDNRKERIASLETKLDRIQNPFKWHLVDQIGLKNYKILFGTTERSASIINADVYADNLDGEKSEMFNMPEKFTAVDERDNAVEFSSNGFYLRLINKKELLEGEGIIIDGPDARYDLVDPKGLIVPSVSSSPLGLDYKKGVDALVKAAQSYQEAERTKFETEHPEINLNNTYPNPIDRDQLFEEEGNLKTELAKTIRQLEILERKKKEKLPDLPLLKEDLPKAKEKEIIVKPDSPIVDLQPGEYLVVAGEESRSAQSKLAGQESPIKSETEAETLSTPAEKPLSVVDQIGVGVGSLINYQGTNFRIEGLIEEKGEQKYKLVAPSGKPVYKLTKEQLAKVLEEREAIFLGTATEPEAPIKKVDLSATIRETTQPAPPAPLPAPEPKTEKETGLSATLPEIPPIDSSEQIKKIAAIAELVKSIEETRKIIQEEQRAMEERKKTADREKAELLAELAATEKQQEQSAPTTHKETPSGKQKVLAQETPVAPVETTEILDRQIAKIQQEIDELLQQNVSFVEKKGKLGFLNPKNVIHVIKIDWLVSSKKNEEKKLEKRREVIYKRAEKAKIEEDKKINPFKYFVVDHMGEEACRVVLRSSKDDLRLEELNRKLGENGKQNSLWDFQKIIEENNNIFSFSSNGFTLRLLNKKKLIGKENGKKVILVYSPKAQYNLISPSGEVVNKKGPLDHVEGAKALETESKAYQDKLREEFAKG